MSTGACSNCRRPVVFLIGLPACGKTTLGQALARLSTPETPISFTDLDSAVEAGEGISISRIFAEMGEPYFRHAESRVLRLVAETPGRGPLIVACGGGTPCNEENIAYMLERGHVVELQASREATLRRLLEAPPEQRPLVSRVHGDPDLLGRELDALAQRRAPWYGRAHSTFDSTRLETPRQVASTCREFIRRFGPLLGLQGTQP
ncbi:MAG: shikimate kinase [Muribaculaceae bacterium]|nr:shikimate kinase [Muribaculaceae bacterium]